MKKVPVKPKSTKRPAKKKTWRKRLSDLFPFIRFFLIISLASYVGDSLAHLDKHRDPQREGMIANYAYLCGKYQGQLTLFAEGNVYCDLPASTTPPATIKADFI